MIQGALSRKIYMCKKYCFLNIQRTESAGFFFKFPTGVSDTIFGCMQYFGCWTLKKHLHLRLLEWSMDFLAPPLRPLSLRKIKPWLPHLGRTISIEGAPVLAATQGQKAEERIPRQQARSRVIFTRGGENQALSTWRFRSTLVGRC
jgi:hypothetical protein